MEKRIVFFGNSIYSVIDAQALHERFGLSCVVTIPDQVSKKGTAQSPVKIFAREHRIPVIETDKITPEVVEKIRGINPDFLIVADYGLILPKSLLEMPAFASLNVHHSLLPKYRGPAPAPAAILNGDEISGVSIITMSDKVDAGDVLKQKSYTLKPNETTDSLLRELNILGSSAVVEVIEEYLAGTARPAKQDETRATYTKYMTRQDGLINLSDGDELNWRKIRAYGAWPGTYFVQHHKGKETRVKIKEATLYDRKLVIKQVIPENKKEMPYEDFLRGLH